MLQLCTFIFPTLNFHRNYMQQISTCIVNNTCMNQRMCSNNSTSTIYPSKKKKSNFNLSHRKWCLFSVKCKGNIFISIVRILLLTPLLLLLPLPFSLNSYEHPYRYFSENIIFRFWTPLECLLCIFRCLNNLHIALRRKICSF